MRARSVAPAKSRSMPAAPSDADHVAGQRAGKTGVGVQQQAGVVDQARHAQRLGSRLCLVCDDRLEIEVLQLRQFEVRLAERDLHAGQDVGQRAVLARIARQQQHGNALRISWAARQHTSSGVPSVASRKTTLSPWSDNQW